MPRESVIQFVRQALAEDIGHGDVTTDATVDAQAVGRAQIIAKEDLVVCGHELAGIVFGELALQRNARLTYMVSAPDGGNAPKGAIVARIEGPLRIILTGERVALNLLMKLSGIATNVRRYVAAAGPDGPTVVDTRKTTPLLREWEKYAVRVGGGRNHRHALYDGILIKDNHIKAAGGVSSAILRATGAGHHLLRVECEVTNLDELEEALAAGVDALLLDNMDDALLAAAVEKAREIQPGVILEASGNMTPERIARIKHLELDYISAGGLIHQARWVDLSLDVL